MPGLQHRIPILLTALLLTAACTTPAAPQNTSIPLLALDKACETPAPQHPDLHLTIARQSVNRSGAWRAYPGWTIPVPLDGSYQATLSIPTKDGYGYDAQALKLKLTSHQWRIADGSERFLPSPAAVGTPGSYSFVIVPNQPAAAPGTANSTPPSASMIRVELEGLKTPDGKPVAPLVLRVVNAQETMPACPSASIPEQGPVNTREKAIAIATGGRTGGKWDAKFVKDYVPPITGKAMQQEPRDTWIVQRLHPGPNETVYIDAKTGAPYMVRQSEAPAPVTLD